MATTTQETKPDALTDEQIDEAAWDAAWRQVFPCHGCDAAYARTLLGALRRDVLARSGKPDGDDDKDPDGGGPGGDPRGRRDAEGRG